MISRTRVFRPALLVPALLVGAMATIGPQAFSRPQSATPAAQNGSSATPDIHGAAPSTLAEVPSSISVGDLLNISVFGVPDYAQDVRVDATGQVALPFIGEVKLAGLSLGDAEALLTNRLKEERVFKDPQVTIMQKEYGSQDVTVLGEVQKPGLYPLVGKRTLFDAMSAAGGITAKAGNTAVITHRDRPQDPETIPLAYDAGGLPKSNIPVTAGDTVVVSKAGIVYVVGDVRVPTGVLLENPNLTVLKAIAMAQGVNPTASENKSRIIRNTPQGQQEIPVELKKILSAKAPDLPLQPDDVLFIPTSAAKSAFRRGTEAMVQAATGVAIYRPFY
jgi:polysaccharide biosynthesis/export protein